jgi:hypothetical protein
LTVPPGPASFQVGNKFGGNRIPATKRIWALLPGFFFFDL